MDEGSKGGREESAIQNTIFGGRLSRGRERREKIWPIDLESSGKSLSARSAAH